METLGAVLAVNGIVVLAFSSLVGLLLARSIYKNQQPEHWHLLHASGTSRGIMLLALATTIQFAELPPAQIAWAAGLVVFFVWTSVLAMFVRALTGEKGFHPRGPRANQVVFLLYAAGTIALPIGLIWLGVGFLRSFL